MHRMLKWMRAAALGAALSIAMPQQVTATTQEALDNLGYLMAMFPDLWIFIMNEANDRLDHRGSAQAAAAAAAATGITSQTTFSTFNFDATLEAGEPNPSSLMTKTIWAGFTPKQAGRIVIHTFGSSNFDTEAELNTVLAAYRGKTFASMVRLASNDNKPVDGIARVESLIQFNVAANTPYRIQIGSRSGDEGDIYANVFVFPPGGGLSAFLSTFGGVSFEGRDYICELGYSHGGTCSAAKFIVHNSTAQTLTVTPATTLGGAFINPAAFTLAPGEAKTTEFTFNTGFSKTPLRTIAGAFTFTGRAGSTIVSLAKSRALVVVKSDSSYGPDVLRASVNQQVKADYVNNAVRFDVKLINTGTAAATGCHARSEIFARIQTIWQEYDPGVAGTTIPATIGAPSVPVTIPAGGFKWLRVWVASQAQRDGDPAFSGEVIIDCANTAELLFNASNRFDVTEFGSFDLRDVDVAAVSPTNGVLDVPASGTAKFRASVVNKGPAAQMRVNAYYEAPFDDPVETDFVVTGVCEANAAGTCIGPTDGVLIYNAPANVKKYFTVFVQAPTVNPGYDPARRRVFLYVRQLTPDNVTADRVLVGARGIAVKKL